MDIIERLRRWDVAWSDQGEDCAAAADEIERLRAELDEYRRDAERYRWLRLRLEVRDERMMNGAFRKCIKTRIGRSIVDMELPFSATPERDAQKSQELDAAIDAALRGEGE